MLGAFDMAVLEFPNISDIENSSGIRTVWKFRGLDGRCCCNRPAGLPPRLEPTFKIAANIFISYTRATANRFLFPAKRSDDHERRCNIDERPNPPRIFMIESDFQP